MNNNKLYATAVWAVDAKVMNKNCRKSTADSNNGWPHDPRRIYYAGHLCRQRVRNGVQGVAGLRVIAVMQIISLETRCCSYVAGSLALLA